MMTLEQQMARALEGHHYVMRTTFHGENVVIDAGTEVPVRAASGATPRSWTEEEDTDLVSMRAMGRGWDDISFALHRSLRSVQQRHCAINKKYADLVSDQFVPMLDSPVPKLNQIITEICAVSGLPKTQLCGRGRTQTERVPRQAYCWLAYRLTRSSYKQIAQPINRDHSTIIHAIEVVQKDPATFATIINAAAANLGVVARQAAGEGVPE